MSPYSFLFPNRHHHHQVHKQVAQFPKLYDSLSSSTGTDAGGRVDGGGEFELSLMTPVHRDIEMDLYRTFPEHSAFEKVCSSELLLLLLVASSRPT